MGLSACVFGRRGGLTNGGSLSLFVNISLIG